MKIYIYEVRKDLPAPAGGGDSTSWFMYYKWDVGDRTYVPLPASWGWYAADGEVPADDDALLFLVDGVFIGWVAIERVEQDPLSGKTELWYHTDSIRRGRALFPVFSEEDKLRVVQALSKQCGLVDFA